MGCCVLSPICLFIVYVSQESTSWSRETTKTRHSNQSVDLFRCSAVIPTHCTRAKNGSDVVGDLLLIKMTVVSKVDR